MPGQNVPDSNRIPDSAEQIKMVNAMRKYAESYVSNLPNFLCEQVTRQREASRRSEHWHKNDTLTSKLIYNHGHEVRTLELVNGKALKLNARHRAHTPLTTEGEFGILLSRVFNPDSEAQFRWNGWQELRGRRCAVFGFSVDKDHSTLRLSDDKTGEAIVPYTGSVYVDPETGAVWRIRDLATEFPHSLLTDSVSTTIDYGEVAIGEKGYWLPTRAVVDLSTTTTDVRNEIEFRNYRKFEAESTITFQPDLPRTVADRSPK